MADGFVLLPSKKLIVAEPPTSLFFIPDNREKRRNSSHSYLSPGRGVGKGQIGLDAVLSACFVAPRHI